MAKRIVSFGMVQVVFNDFGLDVVAGKNVSKKLHFVITGHYRTLGVFVQISGLLITSSLLGLSCPTLAPYW